MALNQQQMGHAVMSSIALERIISNSKSYISRVPTLLRKMSQPILGHEGKFLGVTGDGSVAGVLLSLATDVLVSCAEIAWVSNCHRRQLRKKANAEKNIKAFMQWRHSTFADVSQATSTMMCIAALAGNNQAAAALKALKVDAEELRNGAFDAVHLDQFLQASRPDRDWVSQHGIAVFVTSDKGLAKALDSIQAGWVGKRGTALVTMSFPWLSPEKVEQTRQQFLRWRAAVPAQTARLDVRALFEIRKILGFIPKKVQFLFCRTQDYRRHIRATRNRKPVIEDTYMVSPRLLRASQPVALAKMLGPSVLSRAFEARIGNSMPHPSMEGQVWDDVYGNCKSPEMSLRRLISAVRDAWRWSVN